MTDFKMSWYNFQNHQFVYDGKTYQLCQIDNGGLPSPIIHYVLFLLNIHRGRFVSRDDLIDFMYDDQHPDEWPDYQNSILSALVHKIRTRLPEGVNISRQYGYGYKLEIRGEK